jgi:phosphate starvation-inducible membrane PsiE
LPLSVLSVLIVISRYYDPAQVMYLLGPLLGLCAGLTILGIYLILAALKRIWALNRVIFVMKSQNSQLRELSLAMKENTSTAVDPQVVPDLDF